MGTHRQYGVGTGLQEITVLYSVLNHSRDFFYDLPYVDTTSIAEHIKRPRNNYAHKLNDTTISRMSKIDDVACSRYR
jgi:hypothetical protein